MKNARRVRESFQKSRLVGQSKAGKAEGKPRKKQAGRYGKRFCDDWQRHKLPEGLEYGAKEAKEKEVAVSGSILIWQSFLAFRCLYFGRLYITLRKADKR